MNLCRNIGAYEVYIALRLYEAFSCSTQLRMIFEVGILILVIDSWSLPTFCQIFGHGSSSGYKKQSFQLSDIHDDHMAYVVSSDVT